MLDRILNLSCIGFSYFLFPIKQKTFYLLLALLLSFTSFHCHSSNSLKISPKAENGVINLSEWNFDNDGLVLLDGTWEFYWNQFLISKPPNSPTLSGYIEVPAIWNGFLANQKEIDGFGYASYRLRVILPERTPPLYLHLQDFSTACIIWINGKKIIQNGVIGTEKRLSVPQTLPMVELIEDKSRELTITLEISNYSHYKGGAWESLRIGNRDTIEGHYQRKENTGLFLFGSILIMSLYHFGLFSLRRKDLSSLYFALFCITITFRILTTERLLFHWFPNLYWEVGNKIEYIGLYMAIPLFYHFLRTMYPNQFSSKVELASYILNGSLSIVVIVTPAIIYTRTLIPVEIWFLVVAIYGLFALSRAIYYKQEGAAIALVGYLALIITGINDILYSQLVINTGYTVPIGLFFFIFSQSYMLSQKFSKAFYNVETLSEDLQKTNEAYSRFVPMTFLNLLGKNNILDIQLGDQVQREMAILFSDIRSFTAMSEKMSPKENFDFINSYLQRMGPIIRNNNGFIDKYIGDGIMALFPEQVEDAIDAAISMEIDLQTLNEKRRQKNFLPINVGIGIHSGNLMLGTIGENQRMDGSVISDAVNLASRIESLTKLYGSSILISESIFQKIKNPAKYFYRKLDDVQVKGKEKSITIYEIMDGDKENLKELKIKTLPEFHIAIEHYQKKEYVKAAELFQFIIKINPQDKASEYFLGKCNESIIYLTKQ